MNAVLREAVHRGVRGAKGGDAAASTPTEAPDSLHSVAYARILDLVSEGEIQGFAHPSNPLQDIFLDSTPLANADGTLNFQNVQVDSRSGTQTQTVLTGFPDVENETAVNLELKSSVDWTQAINDLALNAVRVMLSVPALSQSNTSTGDITGYSIQYEIELSTDGGSYQTMLTSAFTGKTTSKYERSHRIDLPAATSGWTLRVHRITANQNLATVADTMMVESYTEIVDAKFSYPNSAVIGLIIDSQQFSAIPQRAYNLLGRIVSVPSNYNPTTRVYTGAWDGSFKPAWTNNPAWIFYDLATNARYGLGQYITAAQVNKWNLYKIAQYCDGLVPDGMGGQEPRFTCTLYLQQQADAYKVLQDLATVFRGISFWGAGQINAVADMPSDPVYPYTAANVLGGKFTYQGSGKKTRFTVALVSWNDPTDLGRAKVEYVPDREGIARYGINITQVTATGATSRGQAQRVGLWTLLTSRLETETVSFGVGLDGTIAAPGQVIRIADPARAGKRQAGRIHSATATAITVDAAPTVAVGDSLTCTLPTGVTETHTVTAVADTVISVGAPGFSAVPQAEAVWVTESTSLAAATYRVVSVTEDQTAPAMGFTLTALAHNASKFAAIDSGAPIVIPPITAIPPSVQPAPATVTLSAYPTFGKVLTQTTLTIQWDATPDAVLYHVEWRKDSGDWQVMPIQRGLSVDVHVWPGSYLARVAAVNASGIGSIATASNTYVVVDQTQPSQYSEALSEEVATAQSAANAANAQLAATANADVMSSAEKPGVIQDYANLTNEQSGIDAQAANYGITTEKTTYDDAISVLTTYLETLTAPTAWNDKSGNTTIVPATFDAKWGAVYTARQALLNAIYAAAQALAGNAQTAANNADAAATAAQTAASNAASAASTAQSAANAAQSSANTANAGLSALENPNILSPGEKPAVITDYANITGEQSGIDAQAASYGVTSQKTTYDNAISTLTSYLSGLATPVAWNDQSGNTTIDGPTFSANFTTVYTSRQALLNAIYAAAKTASGNAQSAATSAANAAAAAQSTANSANSAAATAQTAANAANAAAATAQTAANNADAAAQSAQSTANTANSAAASAQSDATAAQSQLADIDNDNLLTPVEKPPVVTDYNNITGEQAGIDAQATAFAVSSTTYDNAVTALTSYLDGLTSPTTWNDTSGNTTIDGPTFSAKFTSVYTSRQALLNAIYAAAQSLANAAQSTANTADSNAATAQSAANSANSAASAAQTTANNADSAAAAAQTAANNAASAAAAAQSTANTANSAANAAQASATSAENQLADIASSGILSPGEKPPVITDYANITGEQSGIDAQATSYGITTEKTAYDNAVSALTSYLNGLTSPVAWNDVSGNTTANGATLRGDFTAVYTARQTVLNEIYATAKSLAATAQSAANTAQTAANNANAAAAAAQSTANSAQSAAATAQTAANAANAQLADVASDNVLSPAEKPTVIRDYAVITTERAGIDSQATAFGVSATAYNNAVSALTSYLNALVSPTAWNDKSGNTTVVGTTLRSNFNTVYTTRQTLLNAIYAAAKGLANTAQNTANDALAAISANLPPIQNPSFATGDLTAWAPDNASEWSIGPGPSPFDLISTYVQHQYVNDGTTALRNVGVEPVQAGDVITVTAQIFGSGTPSGSAWARIEWFDNTNTFITAMDGSKVTGNGLATSRANQVAPTNAVGCRAALAVDSHTTGIYAFTGVAINGMVRSLDEVPDGDIQISGKQISDSEVVDNAAFELPATDSGYIYGWRPATNGTGAPALTLNTTSPYSGTQSLHVVNTGVNSGASSTRTYKCRPGDVYLVAMRIAGGIAGTNNVRIGLTFFGGGSYINRTTAALGAGSAYQLLAGQVQVPPGADSFQISAWGAAATVTEWDMDDVVLAKMRTQDMLSPTTWAGVRSVLSKSPISFSVSGTTVHFSTTAFTNYGGGLNVAYSASSGSVTQTANTTVTYYLYFIDPTSSGGSQTLHITSTVQDLAQSPYIAYIGNATVTVASGGGGSSGGGGGGGGFCVCMDMWIDRGTQAKDAMLGHPFDCCDFKTSGTATFKRPMLAVEYEVTDCVRLTTEHGAVLDCGVTTPFDTIDGRTKRAPQMLSELVLTDAGLEQIVRVEPIGIKPVCFFHFGGISYAAGRDPSHRIYSHNPGVVKP